MRRMLLGACVVALGASVAVVALAAEDTATKGPPAQAPADVAAPPESGPFAVAAQQAQTAAVAEHHRTARDASAPHEHREPRPSSAPHGARVQIIARVAERLDVSRRTMWRAVGSVRRQISPREWSDARGEALRMLARELDRPYAEVAQAVRVELRRELSDGDGVGYGAEAGR